MRERVYNLGKCLSELRKSRNITREDLLFEAGRPVTLCTLRRWEVSDGPCEVTQELITPFINLYVEHFGKEPDLTETKKTRKGK